MKVIRMLLLLVVAAGTAIAQSADTKQQSASPSNDQGTSAYGNGTYSSGAHADAPASTNASPATAKRATENRSDRTGSQPTSGSPNASHTNDTRMEPQGGSNESTNPSVVDPGNGNSPGGAPPGSSGSNTGGPPRSELVAPRADAGMINASYIQAPQKSEPNQQVRATPQANAGAQNATPATAMPAPAESNATLRGHIQQALQNESGLDASHISVNVTDNSIELSGSVPSSEDKQTAQRIAQSFDGNRKFNDSLTVSGQAPTAGSGARSGAAASSAKNR